MYPDRTKTDQTHGQLLRVADRIDRLVHDHDLSGDTSLDRRLDRADLESSRLQDGHRPDHHPRGAIGAERQHAFDVDTLDRGVAHDIVRDARASLDEYQITCGRHFPG